MKYIYFLFSNLWKLYVIVIFTFVGVVLYPFIRVLLLNEKWKRKSHSLFVLWSWAIRIICLYPIKKVKNSRLPDGPFIIISNHSSYIDIFLMHSILPKFPFLFLGKSELLKYPIVGSYFKNLHIPVFRNNKLKAAKSFIHAKNAVKNNWSLMIFPEGGIPDENLPKMIPFKEGAFKLAKSLHIPIVPITFTTNYHLFSDPGNFTGGARPGFSKVYIHEYLSVEEISNLAEIDLIQKCYDIINEPLINL